MASGTGNTLITFTEPAIAAKYETKTVVTDINPNPNVLDLIRPFPSSLAWRVACYSNSLQLFVCTAQSTDTYLTSTNGISWVQRTLPNISSWSHISFQNDRFILMNNGFDNFLLTSTNGTSWNQRSLPATNFWNAVTYGNGLYVACSSNTNFATSSDSITWTPRTVPNGNWFDICYGNGIFVSVDPTIGAIYSSNGTSWNTSAMPFASSYVAFGNGVFVCIDSANSTLSATSLDGINWVTSSSSNLLPTESWSKLQFTGSRFIAIAASGNTAVWSVDGKAWNIFLLPILGGSYGSISSSPTQSIFVVSGENRIGIFKENLRNTTNQSTLIEAVLPTPGANQASVTITGLTGFNATDSVQAWIMGSDFTSSNSSYEHSVAPIDFYITNPITATGFTINAKSPIKLDGDFKVRYVWTS